MTDVPEGARLSDDGQWWWDESAQQWQAVQGGSASASSSTGGADASGDGGDEGAASSGGDAGQAAARVAAGLPASLHEITDEQRAPYIGEPQVSAESVELDTVETVAMDDSGENGEAVA